MKTHTLILQSKMMDALALDLSLFRKADFSFLAELWLPKICLSSTICYLGHYGGTLIIIILDS